MSIGDWLAIEEPDAPLVPQHACILTDGHGHAVLYTPRLP